MNENILQNKICTHFMDVPSKKATNHLEHHQGPYVKLGKDSSGST